MSTDALAEELKLVEEDLARLRGTAAGLRRRIGDRDEEPTDAAERSALIEGTAEVEWRAVEHLPRLPVTGYKPRPGELQPGDAGGEDDLAEAACLALPDEWLPASLPAVISNTWAAVSAYAEAITDGVQDRLRLRLLLGDGCHRISRPT